MVSPSSRRGFLRDLAACFGAVPAVLSGSEPAGAGNAALVSGTWVLQQAQATYCEVYSPSFTLEHKAQLAEEVRKFADHCRKTPPLPGKR